MSDVETVDLETPMVTPRVTPEPLVSSCAVERPKPIAFKPVGSASAFQFKPVRDNRMDIDVVSEDLSFVKKSNTTTDLQSLA